MKPEIGAAYWHRGPLGMFQRPDLSILSVVGHIDPVVDSISRIGDARLRIHFRKTSVENLPHIRLAVAVRVLEEQNVRSAGDDQAAVPRRNSTHLENVIREHG